MKKLSYKFQSGNFWEKLFWIILITALIIITWCVVDSVMFFLQTVLTFWGLVILAPIVSLGIIAFSIVRYPKVKDRDSYSKFTQKYL